MNKLLLALTAFVLGACSDDPVNTSASGSQNFEVSEVSILKSDIKTRAPLWGKEFPNGSKIGVSLFYNDSQEALSVNTEWTVNNGQWLVSQPVALSREKATAYAYYPYKENVSDITLMPVNYDQSDYLYGQSTQKDISSLPGKNVATFEMRHIMTRMALGIRKETTYKGPGLLTKVILRNAPRRRVLPTDPSLIRFNAKTGEFTHKGLQEQGSSLELTNEDGLPITYPVTLSTTTEPNPVGGAIIVPFSFADEEIELFLVVDGEEYIVPVLSPKGLSDQAANGGWQANYNYQYKLTLTPKHLSLSSLKVNEWIEVYDTPIEIK